MSFQDRSPIAAYDITPETGATQDVSDESLNAALETSSRAQKGELIRRGGLTKRNLDERLRQAQLTQVDGDPFDTPIDEDLPTESILFKDVNPGDEDDLSDGNDPEDGDDPSLILPIEPGTSAMSDPNQWIINALKTIHSDIQQIKPLVGQIPVVKTRVDEIQGIIGTITSGFIEMKNAIKNMEITITQNRVEIGKLTDLVRNIQLQPAQKVYTAPQLTKPKEKEVEANIDKLVSSLSKKKNYDSEQEIMIRNMILIHDKEVIEETMSQSYGSPSLKGSFYSAASLKTPRSTPTYFRNWIPGKSKRSRT